MKPHQNSATLNFDIVALLSYFFANWSKVPNLYTPFTLDERVHTIRTVCILKKLILFIVTQNSESIDKNHIYVENEYYDSLNVTS